MKCLLSVSVLAAAGAASFAISNGGQTPTLQKGISVQMVTSSSAVAIPEADNEDAWVVTIAESGKLYFGVQQITLDRLTEEMRTTPRKRDQNLYIKADARTRFVNVQKALEVARLSLFDAPVLLTAQPASPRPGVMVPPTGLQVLVDRAHADSEPTVVEVLGSEQPSPTLKINDREAPSAAFYDTIKRRLQNRSQKLVELRADGSLRFAEVAHVIDACRAAGAEVALSTPER